MYLFRVFIQKAVLFILTPTPFKGRFFEVMTKDMNHEGHEDKVKIGSASRLNTLQTINLGTRQKVSGQENLILSSSSCFSSCLSGSKWSLIKKPTLESLNPSPILAPCERGWDVRAAGLTKTESKYL